MTKPPVGFKIDVTDYSDEVLSKFDPACLRALDRCGGEATGNAQDLAPVGTPESTGIPGYIGGTLRGSITYIVLPQKNTVYIGTNVKYARPVEMGTSKMAAQPYLRPAITDYQADYRAIFEEELKNA